MNTLFVRIHLCIQNSFAKEHCERSQKSRRSHFAALEVVNRVENGGGALATICAECSTLGCLTEGSSMVAGPETSNNYFPGGLYNRGGKILNVKEMCDNRIMG